MPNNYI